MDLNQYLDRIHYIGDKTPTLEVLRALQYEHLLAIPFENLDIHYGIPIDLDHLYQKIVIHKRGGFCYELNGLFYTLLTTIGFDARMISARVYDIQKKIFGEEYDHLAIIVTIDQEEYLVDVGFGAFAMYPLKIELDHIQSDPRGEFIIETHNDSTLKVSTIQKNIKSIEYIFTDTKRELNEFAAMCSYHQTSPHSPFTKKKLITRPTTNGRITITANTLKIVKDGVTIKLQQFPAIDYHRYLLQWFDMTINTI